jgi:lysophospholipase L1-like esterase
MTRNRAPFRITGTVAITLTLLLLAASLGINVYLVEVARGYFAKAESLRLDPAGLSVYATERAKAAPTHPLVVLFGDSRAYMWTEPAMPAGFRVVNRGIGFQTTAQMLLRFDADVAALRPDVIVLEAGVNDLKAIADFPAQRDEIVDHCEGNLARIVGLGRQTGARIVIVTVFDIGDVSVWRRPFWTDDVEAAVREVNAFLPTLAADRVVVFDSRPILDDDRGRVRRPYQLDHLHLTRAGYDALNQRLAPFLSALPK